jgi:hypothetical protein
MGGFEVVRGLVTREPGDARSDHGELALTFPGNQTCSVVVLVRSRSGLATAGVFRKRSTEVGRGKSTLDRH